MLISIGAFGQSNPVLFLFKIDIPGIQYFIEGGYKVPYLFNLYNQGCIPSAMEKEKYLLDNTFKLIRKEPLKNDFWGTMVWTNFNEAICGGMGVDILLKNGEWSNISIKKTDTMYTIIGNAVVTQANPGKPDLTGYLIGDDGSARAATNADIRKYFLANLNKLQITVKGDYFLYRGVPWYDYGFEKEWGNSKIGSYEAIDKDGNILSVSDIYNKSGVKIADEEIQNVWRSNKYDQLSYDWEGNYYFSKVDKIYYLGRTWGYDVILQGNTKAEIKLYLHPGAEEFLINTIKANTPLSIQEHTLQKESFDGFAAPWYKVNIGNGYVGWVHGSGITIAGDEKKLLVFDSPVMKQKGLKE